MWVAPLLRTFCPEKMNYFSHFALTVMHCHFHNHYYFTDETATTTAAIITVTIHGRVGQANRIHQLKPSSKQYYQRKRSALALNTIQVIKTQQVIQ